MDTNGPGWERSVLEKLAFAALNEQRAARRCAGWCSSVFWSGR